MLLALSSTVRALACPTVGEIFFFLKIYFFILCMWVHCRCTDGVSLHVVAGTCSREWGWPEQAEALNSNSNSQMKARNLFCTATMCTHIHKINKCLKKEILMNKTQWSLNSFLINAHKCTVKLFLLNAPRLYNREK